MMRSFVWLLLGSLVAVPAGAGENWPQWRGPDGQGHSDSTGLPVEWSETRNVTWKTPLPGKGWSSPVILGNQIWMTTAVEDGKSLRALCVDRESGKLVHNIELFRPATPCPINATNSHASPTSVIEPGRVYVHFGTMGTACLDTDSGKIVWKHELLQLDHKEGPGSSPILHGNLLIIHCDGTDVRYVVALDKETGKIVWKQDRTCPPNNNPDFNKAYSTPLVIASGKQEQMVSPGAQGVNSYDPKTGAELWRVRYDGFSNVPRPIVGNGMVYVSSGYMRPQLLAIRLDGKGDVTASHIAWRATKNVPNKPSPILVGGVIYMTHDQGILAAIDAKDGREVWTQRIGGNFSSSPIEAEGRIYIGSEEGITHVIAAGRQYKSLATNSLTGRIMATPAVAGRAIFLRTDTDLYRIETKATAGR